MDYLPHKLNVSEREIAQMFEFGVQLAVGFSPLDNVVDLVSLATGYDVVTGEKLDELSTKMLAAGLLVGLMTGGMGDDLLDMGVDALRLADGVMDTGRALARQGDELVEVAARHGDDVMDSHLIVRRLDEYVARTDEVSANRYLNGMGSSCGNSFTAGTLVKTEDGSKPIEEIEEGDKVFGEDPETGEQGYFEVVALTNHPTDEVLVITIKAIEEDEKETDSEDNTEISSVETRQDEETEPEVMEITPDHPVYVEDEGWLFAENLEVGDQLHQTEKDVVEVVSIESKHLDEPVLVYNFTVRGAHTYFVLEAEVMVHNVTCSNLRHAPALESGLTRKIQQDLATNLDKGGIIAVRPRPYRAAGLEWKYPPKGSDVADWMVARKFKNGVRQLTDGRKVLSDLDIAGYTVDGWNISDELFLHPRGFTARFNEAYGYNIITHGTLFNGLRKPNVWAKLNKTPGRIDSLLGETVYVFNRDGFVESLTYNNYVTKYVSDRIVDNMGYLYHGTDDFGASAIRKGIDLNVGRLNLDFNPTGQKGFYVTNNFAQAEEWANRIASRTGQNPVVLEFFIPVSELQQLQGKTFREANDEWARFVIAGRQGSLQHTFDFVEGPMLINPIFPVIRGEIPPSPKGYQLAIFTEDAIRLFQQNLR